MIIDIPLTLVITLLISLLSLAGVAYIAYYFFRFMKAVKIFMVNVPFLSPADLNDLEERAKAIDDFNGGNKNALTKYWRKFYETKTEE